VGLILDSSVVIAAERRGETIEKFIEQVIAATGDQEAALSSIGLTELVHGIYRTITPELQLRRRAFIDELVRVLTVWPYTSTTADSGRNHPFRRLTCGRHCVGTRFSCADGQCTPFPADPEPADRSALSKADGENSIQTGWPDFD